MTKYKNAPIDWCPQIPSNWDYIRLKDIATLQSGKTFTADDLVENAPYPVYGGNGLRGYTNSYTNEGHYVLIGRQGALCGNINYADGKFFATEHALVVYTKHQEVVNWLGETLRTANFNRLSTTAAQPGLAAGVLKNQFIPYPPLETRKKIALYINEKSKNIDRKITLLTQKQECYLRLKKTLINRTVCHGLNPNAKMKDSGIKWIGKVPNNWSALRFKDVFKKYTTGITPESKKESNYCLDSPFPWITIADMTKRNLTISNLCLSEKTIREKNPPLTPKGSLLFSFKLSIGKTAFAGKDLYTNEAIVSIYPSDGYNLTYMYYYLPLVCQNNATENIYGAKMLNQKIIANMKLCIPPLAEQEAIAKYLDDKCSKIDTIVEKISEEINLLGKLKKSLINEVITGKRTV